MQRKAAIRRAMKVRHTRRAGEARRRAAGKIDLRLKNYLLEPHPELGV
jgi:hypothetical protein